MGMAAFKNPNNQYKAITIAQTLGDDASQRNWLVDMALLFSIQK